MDRIEACQSVLFAPHLDLTEMLRRWVCCLYFLLILSLCWCPSVRKWRPLRGTTFRYCRVWWRIRNGRTVFHKCRTLLIIKFSTWKLGPTGTESQEGLIKVGLFSPKIHKPGRGTLKGKKQTNKKTRLGSKHWEIHKKYNWSITFNIKTVWHKREGKPVHEVCRWKTLARVKQSHDRATWH